MIVDLFRGPGGWSEGLKQLGMSDWGVEICGWAHTTAQMAGHLGTRADVVHYDPRCHDAVHGLIGSPVCTPFTKGGKRAGLDDQALLHQAVADLAAGRDTRTVLRSQCKDPKSLLTAEPMRFLHTWRPAWVAMEQVPAVLPTWEQYAHILRGWGYSTWCGVLNAADYGLGQARHRAILIASRHHAVQPPEPTHAEHPHAELFGGPERLPWVTMADALGWGYRTRPAPTVTGGGTASGGPEPWSSTSRKAMRAAMDDPQHWAWQKPAPTVGGTVGHVAGKQARGHLNLTAAEAATLQGFRPDYPWAGNKGQVALQIGNAVPPLLAAHVLAAATGLPQPAALPALDTARSTT